MPLLMLFALVAGAGTALSPCVLPILPAVLSAGVTGGRGRPLGVVTGLALSFTFATVGLVYAIDALGLPNGVDRVDEPDRDRKSTRLNSSHPSISYAVFCLKKKIHGTVRSMVRALVDEA